MGEAASGSSIQVFNHTRSSARLDTVHAHREDAMKLAAFKSSTLLVLSLLMLGAPALALDYPTRPIHFIISFAAGGPNDTIGRIHGHYLSEQPGPQVIVDDHVGACGNIGMADVLAGARDGYTSGCVAPNNAINQTLYAHIPFDFVQG